MGLRQGTMAGRLSGALPDPAFWRGKKVFLTGHTGFKGAWLALWLQRLGAEVTGFALPPEQRSLAADAALERRIVAIRGDIRDLPALRRAIEGADPQIVLHLAAQSLVRRSYRQPLETFGVNVMGTAHVLEAAAGRAQAVVCVTSDKCYRVGGRERAYAEDDALGGHDPYSASKAAAELLVGAWPKEPNLAVATVRAGNVVGGGDWAEDRLVPDCIRAFAAGDSVAIRHPRAVRPWQYVLDPLCGYLLLAERLCTDGKSFARPWNFGPDAGERQPVSHVVERLAQAWGGGTWHLAMGEHPHETAMLAVDASLAWANLGWQPRLDLDTALDRTGRFYRHLAEGADAAGMVMEDIEQYEAIGA